MVADTSLNLRRDVLHSWLRVSGFTQAGLARALNVSEGRISQLLHSKDEEPSGRLVAALLSVTNLPFERLFSFQPDRKLIERRVKELARSRRKRRGPAGRLRTSAGSRMR